MRTFNNVSAYSIILAFSLITPAFATGSPAPSQSQKQGQEQKQTQRQEQYQAQSANANNEGVSQAVRFEDKYQAPAVSAPGISASASCYYGLSGGVSGAAFGLSGGKMKLDAACEKRENDRLDIEKARAFMSLGRNDIALAILCKGMDCPEAPPVAPPACPACQNCDGQERIKRAFEACVAK